MCHKIFGLILVFEPQCGEEGKSGKLVGQSSMGQGTNVSQNFWPNLGLRFAVRPGDKKRKSRGAEPYETKNKRDTETLN